MKFQDERYERAVCRWIEVTFDHPLGSVSEPNLGYWEGSPGYSEWTPPEPEEYVLEYKVSVGDPMIGLHDHGYRREELRGGRIVTLVTEIGGYLG
jgi:hypothetical protein